MPSPSIYEKEIIKVKSDNATEMHDVLAVEDPLLIKVIKPIVKDISITMRTPGQDKDLAIGFMFTEGIIHNTSQVDDTLCLPNEVHIALSDSAQTDLSSLERHFYTNSSCGVCGKSSLDSIQTLRRIESKAFQFRVNKDTLYSLQKQLNTSQDVFKSTGGLHAATMFSPKGDLIMIREDVGRHNALDKLIGHAFLNDLLPLNNHILLLSGRASFELIQKAYMAGIQCIAAIGAPSSLAVQLAEDNDITLIGFLSSDRFNIYTDNAGRIIVD